jgi:hypothetical protein
MLGTSANREDRKSEARENTIIAKQVLSCIQVEPQSWEKWSTYTYIRTCPGAS